MRQSLDPTEFAGLQAAERDYFRAWMFAHGYEHFARPTIGQLLEFLIEHQDPFKIEYTPGQLKVHTGWNSAHGWHNREPYNELLACVWSSVAYWLSSRRESYLQRANDALRPPTDN